MNTTNNFRSELELEELWDAVVSRLSTGLQWSLKSEMDPNEFLRIKECLIGFTMTLEVSDPVRCLQIANSPKSVVSIFDELITFVHFGTIRKVRYPS